MSPHCVWLVIVGGYENFGFTDIGGGVKQAFATIISDTNRKMMIIELGNISCNQF